MITQDFLLILNNCGRVHYVHRRYTMTKRRLILNPLLAIAVLLLLSISVAPVMAAAHNGNMVVFTDADNGKTLNMTQGNWFVVKLQENPTTGAVFIPTFSSGLNLISDTYKEDPNPGMKMGVGGTRTWIVHAKNIGDQKFSAVNKKPWIPFISKENVFVMNLNVVKA
jgi:predicted secreted protein